MAQASLADLRVPLVAVTLASRAGYFRQDIGAGGGQVELADVWHPSQFATRLRAGVAVSIESRDV